MKQEKEIRLKIVELDAEIAVINANLSKHTVDRKVEIQMTVDKARIIKALKWVLT